MGGFRFKQFEIKQEQTPMKVGTDGVLLGSWCRADEAESVLDIGTGTGLLALMVAQRNPKAQITAIDIDPAAAAEAQENVAGSKFSSRIRVINQSLEEFSRNR